MNRKKDTQANYFDGLPTAYYDAVFQDGKFFDPQTGNEILLKERARVRIQTLRSDVLNEEYQKHLEKRSEKIINAGEQLHFRIAHHDFTLQLLEDLFLTQEGNRFSKLGGGRCVVKSVNSHLDKLDFLPLEAETLNQAFTQVSIRYFAEKRSHNCNVFKTMWYEERLLEALRGF